MSSSTSKRIVLDDTTRRKRRCLRCQCDRGRRPCEGLPLCKRCMLSTETPTVPQNLTDVVYLDWKTWFSVCQQLFQPDSLSPATAIASATAKMTVTTPTEQPIALEMVFADRLPRSQSQQKHFITLRLEHFEDRSGPSPDSAEPFLRAPSVDLQQLDVFVKRYMWQEACDLSEDTPRSLKEQDLVADVQLFVGYFYLKHNLGTTALIDDDDDNFDLATIRQVAAEFMYALAFRLQMLYLEIAFLCDSLKRDNAGKRHPAVVLYALETCYRMMWSAQPCSWPVPQTEPTHPIERLMREFNDRTQYILDRISTFHCFYSGDSPEAHRTQLLPMVKFARARGGEWFPSQLRLRLSRHVGPFDTRDSSSPGLNSVLFGVIPLLTASEARVAVWQQNRGDRDRSPNTAAASSTDKGKAREERSGSSLHDTSSTSVSSTAIEYGLGTDSQAAVSAQVPLSNFLDPSGLSPHRRSSVETYSEDSISSQGSSHHRNVSGEADVTLSMRPGRYTRHRSPSSDDRSTSTSPVIDRTLTGVKRRFAA